MRAEAALVIGAALVFSVVGVAFLLQGTVNRAGAETATLNDFLSWVHGMAINSTHYFSAPNSTEVFKISVTERYDASTTWLVNPYAEFGLPRGQGKVAIAAVWKAPAGAKADMVVDPLIVNWIKSPKEMGTSLVSVGLAGKSAPEPQKGSDPVVSTPQGYVGMVTNANWFYQVPDRQSHGDYQLFVWF